MNNQTDNRFPKAASICLAFLLIFIALLAGYDENHAAAEAFPDDITTDSSDELVWVRQEPAVINVDDAPLYYENPEPRFAGSFDRWTVNETEIAWETRYVDHGYEWYDLTLRTKFDRPPIVLNPPLRYKITATASHSGTHRQGFIGLQFWYSSPYAAVIEPKEVLSYYPYDPNWDGTTSKEWMINPPAIGREGDEFEITVGWWNCAPCNVTWTYKAEPANAVPHISLEVLQPTVKYQGEEVPPGETFFPGSCPVTTNQRTALCDIATFYLQGAGQTGAAAVEARCIGRVLHNIIKIFQIYEWESWIDDEGGGKGRPSDIALLFVAAAIDVCSPGIHSSVESAPTLELGQGAILLNNLLDGQTFNVRTPLGTAAGEGNFATGYNPDTNAAIFRTYSEPLLVEATSGPIVVLYPNQEVKLTSKGFGPVKEMPRVYLPMVK